MKKVLYSLIIFISSILFINNVNASSFKVDITGDNSFNEVITLNIEVKDIKDFKGSCNGLCGLVANLEYNTKKIELTSIKNLNEFELIQGNNIVLYKSIGIKDNTKILTLTFKNKNLSHNEKTTIKLNNIVASDGDEDIKTENVKKTIKHIDTIDEKTTETTTTTKKRKINYLTSIEISNGKIKFSKDIFDYNITVDYSVDNIEIKATAENSNATIEGLGKHDLKVGNNEIKITVTSKDGEKTVYTLNVKREKDEELEEIIEIEEEKNNKSIYLIPIGILFLIIGTYIIYKKKTSI